MDKRWTEICIAPRHLDVSREFYFIFSERAAWGRGGELLDFLKYFFFPFSTP